MNKKSTVFMIAVIAMAIGMFVSCDILSDGINFSKEADVKKLNKLINTHISEGMLVERITFHFSESGRRFSLCKNRATVVYVDPENSEKRLGIDIDLKTGKASPNSFYKDYEVSKFLKTKATELKDFDFSKIAAVVAAGQKAFKDENLSLDGLGSFEINFTSGDIENYSYNFKLQNRTGSKRIGKRIETSYNEYSFKADKEGNLIE
jgi:hypothetical protein